MVPLHAMAFPLCTAMERRWRGVIKLVISIEYNNLINQVLKKKILCYEGLANCSIFEWGRGRTGSIPSRALTCIPLILVFGSNATLIIARKVGVPYLIKKPAPTCCHRPFKRTKNFQTWSGKPCVHNQLTTFAKLLSRMMTKNTNIWFDCFYI